MYQNKPKIFYLVISIIVIGFITIIGFFIYTRIFSAKLSFVIAPASAEVTLDGKTFSGGRYEKRVQPGEYTITVEKDGFTSETTTINATADQTTNVLIALVSNDSSTANWYIDHPEDSELNDEVGSRIYSQDQTNLLKDYPIVQDLPETARYWTLNYGICPDGKPFCVIIAADTGYYTYALERLASINNHHYILADYPIAFADYTNPFPNLTNTTASDYNSILQKAADIDYAAVVKNETSGDYLIGYISYYDPIFYETEGEKDFYRIILKRDGSNWKVLTKTSLIFYANDYPDIPKDIINLANSQ